MMIKVKQWKYEISNARNGQWNERIMQAIGKGMNEQCKE